MCTAKFYKPVMRRNPLAPISDQNVPTYPNYHLNHGWNKYAPYKAELPFNAAKYNTLQRRGLVARHDGEMLQQGDTVIFLEESGGEGEKMLSAWRRR